MRKSMIASILVLCLLFSTVSVFATIPGAVPKVTINGENYTIKVVENEQERTVRTYNSDGILVEHMQYNKETEIVYDVMRNEKYEQQFMLSSLNSTIRRVDSEGYTFMGNYVVDLGMVKTAVSAMTLFISYGVSIDIAQSIVRTMTEYAILLYAQEHLITQPEDVPQAALDTFFKEINARTEVRGELWMKTDDTYDYSKKIDDFYFCSDLDDDAFLFGPVTTYQKKRNDMKMVG